MNAFGLEGESGKCFCASKFRIGKSDVEQHSYGTETISQKDGEFVIDIQEIPWMIREGATEGTLELKVKGDAIVTPNQVTLKKEVK